MACRSNQTGQFTPCAARRSLPRNCRTREGVWKPCGARRSLHGVAGLGDFGSESETHTRRLDHRIEWVETEISRSHRANTTIEVLAVLHALTAQVAGMRCEMDAGGFNREAAYKLREAENRVEALERLILERARGKHAPGLSGLAGVGGRNVQGTVVVFRQWKDDGDIIAVFPNEKADHRGNVMSYQHVGQHGAASIHAMLNLTRPAPEGAAKEALRRELVGQGYTDLVERRKMT